jgi:prepilin-type N-terminal cleavage/methylation domain-containing protein
MNRVGGVVVRRRVWQGGFTLIEMMVVLAIIVLLVTLGTKGVGNWGEGQKIRKPLDEMKVLAKKAWHRSVSEQRDWEIILKPRSLELRVKQAAREEDQQFQRAADEDQDRGTGGEFIPFENDIRLKVKRFGETQWQEPRPDHWVFQHSGICEPLQFRIERETDLGLKWIEVVFDPLTAGVQAENWSD